jgi:hypothetical protein
MLSCGAWGLLVQSQIMPRLFGFALLLVLGVGNAVARDAVVLPASCEFRAGRLILHASQPTAHEIVSRRERQVFTACRAGGDNRCRRVMVYKFDLACGGGTVSWSDVSAALMAASGTRAWVRNEQVHIVPPRASRLGECEGAGPDKSFMRECEPWEVAESNRTIWVLPQRFAPVHEVGARFIELPPATASAEQNRPLPPSVGSSSGELQIAEKPDEDEVSPADASNAQQEQFERVYEAYDAPPPVPAPTQADRPRRADSLELSTGAFRRADGPVTEGVQSSEADGVQTFARSVSQAIAAAPPENVRVAELDQHEPASSLREWSLPDWSFSINLADNKLTSWLWDQANATLAPLSGHLKDLRSSQQFTAVLMGLALLSGLLSGIGWYSARSRRARASAFRASHDQPTPEFRAATSSGPAFSAGPSSVSKVATGTALLAPTDEKMCGELCRTAQSMLQQIDARMDELQGVAPLRRVLQREMRNLEQFLTAVMTASPAEPEEWRRMRNRLQRIVRELHRLRDIVEGAYRSLSGGGFTSREPPRDKYEAYEALGVNPDVSMRTLKKLVDALRACWHPDLAKDEADRQLREERMKRINIAWDIITSKRQEA